MFCPLYVSEHFLKYKLTNRAVICRALCWLDMNTCVFLILALDEC